MVMYLVYSTSQEQVEKIIGGIRHGIQSIGMIFPVQR